jgi:predicted signal transduction protein with EAL and GGDEF domain
MPVRQSLPELSVQRADPMSPHEEVGTGLSQMATSPSDAVIVRSTIDLGHNLGLRVVAEGVETQHAWQQLSALGCDIAQGYYLGRPMPAAELEQQLTQPAQAAAEIQADARPSA